MVSAYAPFVPGPLLAGEDVLRLVTTGRSMAGFYWTGPGKPDRLAPDASLLMEEEA
jgi:hypothetical protein